MIYVEDVSRRIVQIKVQGLLHEFTVLIPGDFCLLLPRVQFAPRCAVALTNALAE